MKSATSVGRCIGVLLLVQLAGLIVPFVMLHPITGAAGIGSQMRRRVLFRLRRRCFSCLPTPH